MDWLESASITGASLTGLTYKMNVMVSESWVSVTDTVASISP